ncbi:conserved hypothetical protein [Pseudomonas sp. IT-232MI5]|uniref:cupin domain-containing protein n=1 Tax=Pseudomonas sp. IT-232MI5 TaxID=3026442 RepID=UPI0039DFC706
MIKREAKAGDIIRTLDLQPHLEGGYFRRTYQADHRDPLETTSGQRYLMTSIYYLLDQQSPVGQFHFNRSDILHYFHLGDAIEYSLIHADGSLQTLVMGTDIQAGQLLQLNVPGGLWKASRLLEGENGFKKSLWIGFRAILKVEIHCATGLISKHLVTCNVYYVKSMSIDSYNDSCHQ